MRNLTSETHGFVFGILDPLLIISKEFFITLFILLIIFTYNFNASLIVIASSIILIVFFRVLLKNSIYNFSKVEQKLKGKINKTIIESVQGSKFIKSYNLENFFIKKFEEILFKSTKIKYKLTVLQNFPRIWTEIFLLITLSLLAFILSINNYSSEQIWIFLSVFIICMIRIMPASLSIIRCLNQYIHYLPSIDLIKKEIENKNFLPKKINKSENKKRKLDKIELKNIYFDYSNDGKYILNDLSLSFKTKGELIGIYGLSGVGKTTLIDLLIGLIKPIKGEIYVNNLKLQDDILPSEIFGYVPQNTFLFDDTIRNNIILDKVNHNFDEKKYNKIISDAELKSFVYSLPDKNESFVGENGVKISGGQKQRIGIARALASDCKVLILDEATNSLDAETQKNIFLTLKKISFEKSVIVISHDRSIWNYCSKIYEMSRGKLKNVK